MRKSTKNITTSTWTIRDVPNEARNAARIYAKKEEKSLGLWVGESILKACNRADNQPRNVARSPDDIMELLQDMHIRMDQLSTSIKRPWWDKVWGK